MIMKSQNFLLLCLLAILFFACKKEDPSENYPIYTPIGDQPVIHLKMDGVPFNAVCFANTLTHFGDSALSGNQLDITVSFNGSQELIMTVRNFHFQNPPRDGVVEKTYDVSAVGTNVVSSLIDTVLYADTATAKYIEYTSSIYLTKSSDASGYIYIGYCDTINKKFSGNFGFKVWKNDSVSHSFVGTFENQNYSVVNK